MIYFLFFTLFAMSMGMVIGGCYCCGSCSYCSDGIETLSIDLEFSDEDCVGDGCSELTGTYVMDVTGDCSYVFGGTGGSCTTDNCENCDGTDNTYFYCCDGSIPELCSARRDVPDAMICSTDAAGDDCNDTLGCQATADVLDPDATPICASNGACVDFAYIGDPGFSCDYGKDCECTGSCNGTTLSGQATFEVRDVGGTDHLFLVVTVSDGFRLSEAENDLGVAATVDCLTAIDGLGLSFSDATEFPLPFNLCGIPTGTITAIAA